MTFFDASKVGGTIRFLNLAEVVMEQNLDAVLEEIVKQVTATGPGIVVVDSFRTFMRRAVGTSGRTRCRRSSSGWRNF
jgi:circadian clock protein KaiC